MNNFDYLLFQKLNSLAGRFNWLNNLIIFLADYLLYFMVLGGLIYLFFAYQKKWKNFLDLVLATILSRVIFAEGIRFFYYRPRPFLSHTVNQLLGHDSSGSFPSGHMTFIFPLITFIYFKNKKVGIVFGVLGLLMGLARIAAGVHYPFDIISGILIGIFSAWIVEKIMPKIKVFK